MGKNDTTIKTLQGFIREEERQLADWKGTYDKLTIAIPSMEETVRLDKERLVKLEAENKEVM